MDEPEIRVENREELIYLLSEAAEIEHGLMCCYLYAAFSIGSPAQRATTPERAVALKRWRDAIVDVARDEMVHLVLVANVSNAIGAAPHLLRSNFPVSPGYHPAGVVVSLAPFSQATIDHFVFLERPEGVELPDGTGFASPRRYARGGAAGRLTPTAQDYATVGHLYRGIRAGLGHLVESLGEGALFSGNPRLQVGPPEFEMPGLSKVTDLATARAAIDTIVAQGEGTETASERSHYARFVAIQHELRAMLAADPTFEPARGVAKSPVMRRPPTPDGLVWVNAEPAASILDLANALYLLMLRGLDMLFSPISLAPDTRALAIDTAITAMTSITPVAELLTELPAGDAALPRAGMTFTMSRGVRAQGQTGPALGAAAEMARGIAGGLTRHALPLAPSLAPVRDGLTSLAARLLAAQKDANAAS
jgi:Ferritin-like